MVIPSHAHLLLDLERSSENTLLEASFTVSHTCEHVLEHGRNVAQHLRGNDELLHMILEIIRQPVTMSKVLQWPKFPRHKYPHVLQFKKLNHFDFSLFCPIVAG
jgi:hypothetical protein